MANSAYACFKLIDDIIKRGGQQVSDRYIVKKCLSRTVLSNKKLIVNQLMKQTGIKSQFCTINQEYLNQAPRPIKKDKISTKSVNIIQKKNMSRPFTKERGKSSSNSKTRMRKQTQTFDFENTKLMTTKTTLMSEQKKQKRNNFIVELEVEVNQKIQNQSSIQMRSDKIQKEKVAQKIKKKEEEEQEQRRIRKIYNKNSFNRELNSGKNQHTYHTDGKYLVYSTANQKTLDSQFPISMSSIVSEKIKNKKLPIEIKQSTLEIFRKEGRNRVSDQEILFNNNNKRQISSFNFINAKPGVSFTEPSQGATIRGDKDQQEQNLVLKQRKSTFNKFFTKESTRKAKTQYHESNQKLVLNKLSLGTRSNRTKEIMTEKLNLQPFNCERRKGGKGKIKDVNETLFTKYFNMK